MQAIKFVENAILPAVIAPKQELITALIATLL